LAFALLAVLLIGCLQPPDLEMEYHDHLYRVTTEKVPTATPTRRVER
jgi:hypothetical protein